ncbi:MAG: EAL domain-containing protein [Rhizobiales bacterium]|nr:EAL domain-containing protein [Hyphomicrobiales bacterium]
MKKLFAKQLVKATRPSGEVDLEALAALVVSAYEDADRDARRIDRSMSLMIEELGQVHQRLLDAFEAVPEGLVMFDTEDRYVLWNRRYAELHADVFDELAVGMRFEDAIRAAVAKGRYPEAVGREEEWLAERLARHARPKDSHEYYFPGDRWIRVEERRTVDGGSIGVRIDITEMKQREESFRLLFDSNPVPMWVLDLESHKFLAVNDAALAHYGYTREQFLALTVFDIRPHEDREKLAQFMREGKDSYGETIWRHQKSNGAIIQVYVYSRSLKYQGRVARLNAIIDVTERKHAEDDLHRTKGFLNAVIENVPTTIIVKDARDCRFALINRAGEEFFGVPRGEMIGKNAYQVYPKERAESVIARDRQALQSDSPLINYDHLIYTPGNGARTVTSKKLAIRDNDGEPQYLLTVIDDVTDRKRAEQQIAHLAHHDPLTNLPNRASFNEHFESKLRQTEADGQAFAVMCINLDRFRNVNDVFGHSTGDRILCDVSDRLKNAIGKDAFLARLGGDEFALIAALGSQPEAAATLAERLLAKVSEGFDIEGQLLRTGLSIGVAVYPNDGTDMTTLLGNADAALHRAKAEGRGAIRFFEAEMDQRLRERRALQHDLKSAMERNELVLHFQPQAHIDGMILGFEALVRWRHPKRGSVSPSTFIPIAEESELIIPMGEWILRTACHEAATWPRPLQIAINLSPIQFRHGDLPGLVHTILLETGLTANRLELEITEGALIGDFSRAVSILRRLKALGVRIAMDDFGTGYSSLSYLQSFPFDKIKIDQTFISNLNRNAQSAAIVRAVVGLGHGLKLPVVAEGVETEDQLAFLKNEACDEVQGFLIGRPRPIQDYAELVGRQTTMTHLSRTG